MRLAILPLAIVQMRSMRGMQKIAPELKKLKEKHKGDNQKLQAEMMAAVREHGVNPVGSCLPLLFQLPVFMGLFFVLRGFAHDPPPGDLSFLGGFIPNIAVHVNDAGYAGWVLIAAYVAQPARLHAPDADRRRSAAADDAAPVHGDAVHLRLLRDPLPGRPDDLLDLHQPVDGRPAGHAAQADGPAAEPAAAEGEEELPRIPKPSGGKGLQGAGRSRRR